MAPLRARVLCAVTLALAPATALAGPILDQSFTYPLPSGGAGFGSSCYAPAGICASMAQTFTAGLSGLLTGASVDIQVGYANPASPPTTGELYLSIVDAVSGAPGPNELTSLTIPLNPALFPAFPITHVFALPPVPVVAGTQYALKLSMSDEVSVTWFGSQSFGGPTGYPGGGAFARISPMAAWGPYPWDADLHFETFVDPAAATPVPEPSTWLLLGTGLAAAGMRRRMRKRG